VLRAAYSVQRNRPPQAGSLHVVRCTLHESLS